MDQFDERAREIVPCPHPVDVATCPFHWNSCARTKTCDLVDDVAAALREAAQAENEACAKIAEAEQGEGFYCRHVDHSQGFCACADKAAAIRARIKT